MTAERELLSKTLSGSVKMLTDVLSLVSPTAFGRASRIREPSRKMAQILGENELWMIEIAAMLSQVGCIAVPENVLARHVRGEELSRSEQVRWLHTPWSAATCSRKFHVWKASPRS